jgi:hypothetical protein
MTREQIREYVLSVRHVPPEGTSPVPIVSDWLPIAEVVVADKQAWEAGPDCLLIVHMHTIVSRRLTGLLRVAANLHRSLRVVTPPNDMLRGAACHQTTPHQSAYF